MDKSPDSMFTNSAHMYHSEAQSASPNAIYMLKNTDSVLDEVAVANMGGCSSELDENQKYIAKIETGSQEDRAFGCFFGLLVGGACGAPHGKFERLPTKEEIERSMRMEGGRHGKLGPGQITGESELAMSLTWGLIEGNCLKEEDDERVLDCDIIAHYYKSWMRSRPQSIADSIQNGFRPLMEANPTTKALAHLARKAAQEIDPMCNAALTRIVPMAIFVTNMLEMKDVKEAVIADVSFTHANTIVQETCFLYSSCIHYLLNNVGDPLRAQKAFDKLLKLAQSDLANSIDYENSLSCLAWIQEAKTLSD